MADDEDVKPRKEREPISLVCFVVLIVATVAVAGAYVNDDVLNGDSTVSAVSGSKVTVEYTGALYAQYDNGGAIFDTNVESIANSTVYVHSAGYTAKSSYSTLSVEIGSGGALAAFENALIGAREGDTVTVIVSAAEGYAVADTTASMANSFQAPVQQKMSASAYKSLYGEDAVSGTTVTTVNGWDAIVTVNTDGTVSLNNMAVKDTEYDIKSDFATVKAKVTDVSSGSITYSLSITDEQTVNGSIYSDFKDKFDENSDVTYSAVKMIKVPMYSGSESTSVYIIGIGSDGSLEYRTVGDTKNVDMYFTIKVVSIS